MLVSILGSCERETQTASHISHILIRVRKKGSFGKGVFSEKSVCFLEILENLEILEKIQTVENKGESDHFLEILENLEIL